MRFKEIVIKEKKLMEKYQHRFEDNAAILPEIKFHPRNHGSCCRYYILKEGMEKETYLSWKTDGDLIKKLLERQNAMEKKKITEKKHITFMMRCFLKQSMRKSCSGGNGTFRFHKILITERN